MCDHSAMDELFVARKEYFGHDVALVAIEFDGFLGSQIIETIGFWIPVSIE